MVPVSVGSNPTSPSMKTLLLTLLFLAGCNRNIQTAEEARQIAENPPEIQRSLDSILAEVKREASWGGRIHTSYGYSDEMCASLAEELRKRGFIVVTRLSIASPYWEITVAW